MDAIQLSTFGTSVNYSARSGEEPITISAVLSSAAILEDRSPGSYDHAFVRASALTVPATNGDVLEIVATSELLTVTNVEADAEGGLSLTLQQRQQ